jgi:hypothetical protein
MAKIVAVEEAISETTHIGVLKITQKRISILTKVISAQQPNKVTMAEVVENLASIAWQQAKDQGLVTDAMLKQGNDAVVLRLHRGIEKNIKIDMSRNVKKKLQMMGDTE